MIYSIAGKLLATDVNFVVIETGGVGFRCFTTMNTMKRLGKTGDNVSLRTYLSVKEDALDLYGFHSESELETFKLLLSVSGVGPKAALGVLSHLSPDKLALCVATKDIKSITGAQGIGKKTAERIVLELKDKLAGSLGDLEHSELAGTAAVMEGDHSVQAVEALVALGYAQSEAATALRGADPSMPVEAMIKTALKNLMG